MNWHTDMNYGYQGHGAKLMIGLARRGWIGWSEGQERNEQCSFKVVRKVGTPAIALMTLKEDWKQQFLWCGKGDDKMMVGPEISTFESACKFRFYEGSRDRVSMVYPKV